MINTNESNNVIVLILVFINSCNILIFSCIQFSAITIASFALLLKTISLFGYKEKKIVKYLRK